MSPLLLCLFPLFSSNLGELRAELPDLFERARLPGMTVAALIDEQTVWTEHFGHADTESEAPIDDNTLFSAGSLSKPVFAYLCMKLVDEGVFDLDIPLSETLTNKRMSGDKRYKKITARMVLSHRTGLPNWIEESLSLSFNPGAGYSYSGEGYVYLGQVVAELTGKDLRTLFAEKVFGPLGMSHSAFVYREDMAEVTALGHDEAMQPFPEQSRPTEINVASSLYTTAADYARFMSAVMAGEGLSDATHSEMLRDHGLVGEKAPNVAWALGWGRVTGGDWYWHWGDNGDFKSFAIWNAESRNGLVYFVNGRDGLSIMTEVAERVAPETVGAYDYLSYEVYDAPGRVARIDAQIHLAAKRFGQAFAAFEEVKRQVPDDDSLDIYIAWTEDLARIEEEPVSLTEEQIQRYAGTYGPNVLYVKDGALHYRREGLPEMKLVPLGDGVFAMDGFFQARIELSLDSRGQPTELTGTMITGNSQTFPRDQ